MYESESQKSLADLQHIRGVIDRSARFLSLSGWSGVWAGIVALIAAMLGSYWLAEYKTVVHQPGGGDIYDPIRMKMLVLAILTFLTALVGAVYFTYAGNKGSGQAIWNSGAKKLAVSLALPILAGAVFCLVFAYRGLYGYLVPLSLLTYGLALINSSKYTLTEIRYLGVCEVVLACVCLFFTTYGLYFWAFGFGLLHIVYGAIVRNNHKR